MTDYFAVLNQPRRPWLEPDILKSTFLAVSAQRHPDHVHSSSEEEKQESQRAYADINAAYQCLQNHRDRIRHLIELETDERSRSIQEAPPELAETFMAVGKICHESDEFLSGWSRTSSPLVKAQLFAKAQQLRGRLLELQAALTTLTIALENALRQIDARWEEISRASAHRAELLRQLQGLCQRFSYAARWISQINDRLVRLSI